MDHLLRVHLVSLAVQQEQSLCCKPEPQSLKQPATRRYKAVVVTTEGVRLPASCKAESAPAAPRKMSWLSKAPMQVAEPEQDAATCACWLSSRGDLFAVGYASGVVCLYSIPDAALGVW